jgi:CRISPR-associated protein Cmr5
MSNLKSVEQGRATFAYQFVEDGKELGGGPKKNTSGKIEDSKEAKSYKSYTRRIPMMIKTNGLGNTFAFILAKKSSGNAYALIYEQTGIWLKEDHKKYLLDGKENEDLVKIFIQLDSSKYRAATIEVLAFFNWLRRFAEGLIND